MFKNLNIELIDRLKEIYSINDLKIIEKWFNCDRKTSFRINLLKTTEKEILSTLNEKWLKIKKINFLANCYILEDWREKDLWDLDIFKDWKIYLQQVSSQIPVNFLDLSEWNKVLDITAAPWSKTSQIASILNNTWEIIAIDNNQIRIDKLNFTLNRQWVKNTKVIKSNAEVFSWENYLEYFDNILFDAPCSAEWKINLNNEKSYAFWRTEIIKKNYNVQKNILKNIIPYLKKWWILVYSTCTLSPEENEWIVHFILSNYPELEICDISIDYKYVRTWIKKYWKYIYRNDVTKSIRILPTEETEGFFVAKFRKKNYIFIIK